MQTGELVAAVVDRYDEQAAAYRALSEVAAEIRANLEAGTMDKVQLALSRQVELMAVVEIAGEKVAPLRRELGTSFGYPDLSLALLDQMSQVPPALRPVHEALRRVATLLSDLSKAYEDNQRLLQDRLGTVRSEQATLTRGKTAVQAYRGPVDQGSRFVDKKS